MQNVKVGFLQIVAVSVLLFAPPPPRDSKPDCGAWV